MPGKANPLQEDIKELIRTLRGFNGTPGVMERLTAVETAMAGLSKRVDQLLGAGPAARADDSKNNPDDSRNPYVTWPWIRDKMVQPILILFVGWFFFQLLPQIVRLVIK